MRLSRRKRSSQVFLNMTPMIDIVFLLIIFFMTVSQVSSVDREKLELPKLRGSVDEVSAERQTITINVAQTGQVIVSGKAVSMAELSAILTREVQRQGGGVDVLYVVLRVDQRGTSAAANNIIRKLLELGVRRTRIAVEMARPQ